MMVWLCCNFVCTAHALYVCKGVHIILRDSCNLQIISTGWQCVSAVFAVCGDYAAKKKKKNAATWLNEQTLNKRNDNKNYWIFAICEQSCVPRIPFASVGKKEQRVHEATHTFKSRQQGGDTDAMLCSVIIGSLASSWCTLDWRAPSKHKAVERWSTVVHHGWKAYKILRIS